MTGIFLETPMVNKKNNFYFIPKLSFIINSGQSNSIKISNEESTNNSFSLSNDKVSTTLLIVPALIFCTILRRRYKKVFRIK